MSYLERYPSYIRLSHIQNNSIYFLKMYSSPIYFISNLKISLNYQINPLFRRKKHLPNTIQMIVLNLSVTFSLKNESSLKTRFGLFLNNDF